MSLATAACLATLASCNSELLHFVAQSIGIHTEQLPRTSRSVDLAIGHLKNTGDVLDVHCIEVEGLLVYRLGHRSCFPRRRGHEFIEIEWLSLV